MCGRFTNRLTWREIVELHGLTAATEAPTGWRPRYNAAPTQRMPVLRIGADGKREIVLLRRGLIPPGPGMKGSATTASTRRPKQ